MVIFCHGYKGYKDWGAWNLVAEEFAENGIDFLKFNFLLNGGTLEDPIDFPDLDAFGRNTYSQEVKDLNEVILYVKETYPDKKIALIGHSRGGGVVTLVAGQNQNVDNVISWAGVSDFKSRFPVGDELKNWKESGVRYVLNGRTNQEMPHYYSFYEDFVRNESQLDILQWVKHISKPHLIIHGNEDLAVNVSEAMEIHRANPSSELFLLDTDHTFGSRHPWLIKELPGALETIVHKSIKFVK
ncbi:MAG: alpha/beta fold hydrolase [Flavobacteriales bacterium]|nr:alpha/beta fold hydrolase [Flavobacteriales bacterium]